MAQIGRVYKDSYIKGGNVIPLITLDIRTITVRKKFTISVNKIKFPEGKTAAQGGIPVAGKEEHPDYHIWTNLSNRGESLPSVIVGNIKDAVSENGLAYKRAKIFDPFVQKESIYFTLFAVDADKKIDENHLYNVVAEPYRKMNNTQAQENTPAQASYESESSNQSYTKQDGSTVSIEVNEDECPF